MDGGAPVETVIRIVVPGTPKPLERNRHRIITPKGRPAFVGNYLPVKSRNEQAVIRDFAAQAMGGKPPMEGPIDLRVAVYLPIAASWSKKKQAAARAGTIRPTSKPDFDNFVKLACDSLSTLAFRDDSQVTDAAVFKRYSDNPRLVIEVRPIALEPAQ